MEGFVVTQDGKVPKSRVGKRQFCETCQKPYYDLGREDAPCPEPNCGKEEDSKEE